MKLVEGRLAHTEASGKQEMRFAIANVEKRTVMPTGFPAIKINEQEMAAQVSAP